MNKEIINVIKDIEKVEGIMYAFEQAYIGKGDGVENYRIKCHMENTFYALWDMIHKVTEDVEKIVEMNNHIDVIIGLKK